LPLKKLFEYWRDRATARSADTQIARQYGAIPYTVVDGQLVLLLITSRQSGRWIFPKGSPMKGLEPWEAAAQEALEEAGVEGVVDTTPIGTYRTTKTVAFRRWAVDIEMFPLQLTSQLEDWAERENRHRHWVLLPEAKRLLRAPRLAALAVALSRRLKAEGQLTKRSIDT
jgi:8-oxo-dGTP pyrophosphatase MutT (NUDIX family)